MVRVVRPVSAATSLIRRSVFVVEARDASFIRRQLYHHIDVDVNVITESGRYRPVPARTRCYSAPSGSIRIAAAITPGLDVRIVPRLLYLGSAGSQTA